MESKRPLIIAGFVAAVFITILVAVVVHMGRAAAISESSAPMETAPDQRKQPPMLTNEQQAVLGAARWAERAGQQAAVWVSVSEQTFRIVQDGMILWEVACSTAARGTGSKINSLKTPLGWHSVSDKIGDGAPVGQVFREKRATSEVWHPGDVVKEDLVLTRILVLTGEEPGYNKGGDVDSFRRCIYIHGTNDEANIGRPMSHGCIRLTNQDVIAAFERVPVGTKVLITE